MTLMNSTSAMTAAIAADIHAAAARPVGSDSG